MLLALHIDLICSTTLNFDQVHIKHQRPQVPSPDSQVTIGTIQQTQDVQPTWFEYIHAIVGMHLDQQSYSDSWKLAARLWRYQHEIWLGEENSMKTQNFDKCLSNWS